MIITKLLIKEGKGHSQKDVAKKIFPHMKETTARQRLSQLNHNKNLTLRDLKALSNYFEITIDEILKL